MTTTEPEPQARRLYRKLALGMAIVCFLLAALLVVTPSGDSRLGQVGCLMVGFVMLTIAKTGLWPPPRTRKP